jgi:hypothetical protein
VLDESKINNEIDVRVRFRTLTYIDYFLDDFLDGLLGDYFEDLLVDSLVDLFVDFFGTFAPFLRALDKPIAIAC